MWINLIYIFLLLVVVIAYILKNPSGVRIDNLIITRDETDTIISVHVFHKHLSGIVLDYNHFKSDTFDIETTKFRLYLYDDVMKGTLSELLEACEEDTRVIIYDDGIYDKQDFVKGAVLLVQTAIH